MKRILILWAAVLLSVAPGAQQHRAKVSAAAAMEFGGIKMGSSPSHSQLVSCLGKPTRVETEVNVKTYWFGVNEICTVDSTVTFVSLKDGSVAVLSSLIPGGVRVGDDAAIVKEKLLRYTAGEIRQTATGFAAGVGDDLVNFDTGPSGTITGISYGLE